MLKIKILLFSVLGLIIFLFTSKVDGNQYSGICLQTSYKLYKEQFMSKDGRIIDYDRNGITTSEGQSYMLLRALVVDDRQTFNLVWEWTKNNLQREDKLFSWLWGKNKIGEYKILDVNSASDADVDIAFALLLAHEKWQDYRCLEDAMPIIKSIWDNETKQVGDYLVLMPGVNQTSAEKIEINPSYFSPFAFRLFQKHDALHDWNLLVDSSYYYLEEVSKKTETHLPPDWFLIENKQIVLEDSKKSDFSYDAIRIFARVYLDYSETQEIRALPILAKSKFFVDKWQKDKTFYTNYQANGQLRNKNKLVGAMAIIIPAINTYDKKNAAKMYETQIKPYFESKSYWSGKNDYYDKNLSWFGYYINPMQNYEILNNQWGEGNCRQ